MPTTSVATGFFIILAVFFTATAASSPIPDLDTFLLHRYAIDPLATADSFHFLPSSLKEPLSSSVSIPTLISSLLSFSLPIPIHIRLVGPSFPLNSPLLLASYISAVRLSDFFHLSTTDLNHRSHSLAVKHHPLLDIAYAEPGLFSSLSLALNSSLSTAVSSPRSSLLSVPYNPIDQIISEEFYKEIRPMNGIYIYFLAFGPQFQSRNYAYSYPPEDGDSISSPGGGGFTKCSGTIWTGKERYLWIDLSAGPVEYGPPMFGDGVHIPTGKFHPLAANHDGHSPDTLFSYLASLIWSAYNLLLVPSLQFPVKFQDLLVVQFIHVYGSESGKDRSGLGLDWKKIELTFLDEAEEDGLLLGDQSLVFRTYGVSYAKCAICAFAISRSTTSLTSRFLFHEHPLIVTEYLDSKRLYQVLSDSANEFRRMTGAPEEEFGRVIPVCAFDLDYNGLLLLDRYYQSVSFKDMVIAVRTKTEKFVNDYSCNDRHMLTRTRELERPIVGSILQTMWGVSATHLRWSPKHNKTLVDYTWSVGQTPFGPFSETLSLSFVQKDAIRRNVLLTSLNNSITSAINVLEPLAAHGGDRNFFQHNQRVEFTQRCNLLRYKLESVVTSMSHFEFERALYFLRSSDHDLHAIQSLVHNASKNLEAWLVCFKEPSSPWGYALLLVILVFSLFYLFYSRDILHLRAQMSQS